MNATPATSHQGIFDVDFPLQPDTKSATDVSRMVDEILHTIGSYTGNERRVSPSDVLQALAIASAVHKAQARTMEKTGAEFSLQLLDVAVTPRRREPESAALS